ncbi:MAG: hypothetical protein K2X66_14135, partial [Cyanobacteria bacterium]|nr:hypothetical protein [Cyanobacteriota bacterium]
GNGFATLALSAAGARAVVKGGMPGVSVRGNNAALAGESATAASEAAASTPKSLRFFLKDFFVGGNKRIVGATGEVTEASLARLYWQNAVSGVKGKVWGATEMAAARTASAETALNAAKAAKAALPTTATPAEVASADAAIAAAETTFNASKTEAGLITTAASAPPPTGTRWERFRLNANETYQNGRAFVTDKANRGTIATGLGVGFANNNLSADLNALSTGGMQEDEYAHQGGHGRPTLLGTDPRTGEPVWG